MADNYREVEQGTVEVTYWIVEYDREDGTKAYDWRASNGGEADVLFNTLEEAREDVGYHLG